MYRAARFRRDWFERYLSFRMVMSNNRGEVGSIELARLRQQGNLSSGLAQKNLFMLYPARSAWEAGLRSESIRSMLAVISSIFYRVRYRCRFRFYVGNA